MARRSIRTRLTLLVFAITAAALGFVFVYVAPPLERSLTDQFLDRMADEARRYAPPIVEARDRKIGEVKRIVARAGDRSNARVTLLRVSRGSLGLQTTVIADSVGPPDAGDLQFDVALEAARRRRTATGTEASTRGRLGQAAYPVRRGDAVGQVIVFSAPLNDVENNVALVRRRILVAGAIALLFALAAGSVVAARLSRRINRLERTARSVAHGDLSGRFVVDADDELGQLAVALDDMQRQLGQLDSARKRFIATASHELRTPIFSLGGFLELLQDEDVDPDTREAFLTQVRGQVERLKRLATDLLDLSKLEAGSLELEREPTDLRVLAEAVTSEFQPALARHESKLQLRLGAGMVEADVDPERVAQVMRILIDNALTHTPPGTNMVVTAARQDGQVRLSVRDNGGGIKRQTLERIFEPFYSAGDGQGSGLGLAIARELAERMDGHLSVEAMAGHTTFTLELPRVTHRLAIALAAAALAAGCGGSSGDPRSDGEEAPEAPATTVERQTRVEVIQRIGDEGGFDPKAVFRRDGPGVVTIRSLFTSAENGGDEEEPRGGVGSGFVISERGEIATNAHVVSQGEGNDIKRADEVYVAFADDNQVRATVVGLDPNSDVALLRLNTRAGLTLRPLELGSSDRVRVGEPVAAIGSPFGEEQSLSVGVVSALDRAIESLTGFDTLGAVQTDAAINQGNSGGPLLNGRGEVIGINAQIRTTSGGGEGVGYAIPIDQVKRSVEQIREDGEVRYAYLGVSTSPVYPQLDDRFRLGTDNGAWIQEVVEDGPADDAGLRDGSGEVRFQSRPFKPDGDVITKVEDTPIVSSDDVGLAITRYEPGETVEIEIVRDGERRTVRVKLGERPAQIDQPG